MYKRRNSRIEILYHMGYAPGYAGTPEFEKWNEQIRAAFAEIGWVFLGNSDPMSSTNQDAYDMVIESDGGPLDLATLERVLKQVGIENGGICTGDIIQPKASS